jgi:hypothetical protein
MLTLILDVYMYPSALPSTLLKEGFELIITGWEGWMGRRRVFDERTLKI